MANYYTTSSGAGSKNGTSWDNAFSLSEFATFLNSSANAGDIVYVLSGTYTATANMDLNRVGSAAEPIQIIGVSDTGLTEATDNDRPLFNMANYRLIIAQHNRIFNLRLSGGTNAYTLYLQNAYAKNCYISSSTSYCVYLYGQSAYIENSEIINGDNSRYCVYIANGTVDSCLITGGAEGIFVTNSYAAIIKRNIIRSCASSAIRFQAISSSTRYFDVSKNTIYNCAIGINIGEVYLDVGIIIRDNIFHTVTTIQQCDTTSQPKGCVFDNNVFYGYTNLTAGDSTPVLMSNYYTQDPKLSNPASGNFSLDTDSPYLNSGVQNPFGRA